MSMAPSPSTILPPGLDRETLKTAIRATLREMLADARLGKTDLPPGPPPAANMEAVYRAWLTFVDLLLNRPLAKPAADPKEMADQDRPVDQVDAGLSRSNRRKAGKKRVLR